MVTSPILHETVSYAQQRGALIVAATGNNHFDEMAYPARYEGVIAVTAVDAAGDRQFVPSADKNLLQNKILLYILQ
ncbi:MAG: hypothetical protein HY360_06390 [Verrucomicrobia bacterium]|nr:hypothetical protein [Verrucomicrobiota bacterium]